MSIEFQKVNFIYNAGSRQANQVLFDISFTIQPHEFIGLIGHTGCGKSTLVQHMNGLNLPTSGRVLVNGIDTSDPEADLRKVRQQVGLVFQYPEDQLFEENVYKDISFGPRMLGMEEGAIEKRVDWAMEAVGLDKAAYAGRSPFELSGGEKRRVAIAGVLALRPQYLVLDEPTAGLDPRGREQILQAIQRIYEEEESLSIIMVTHSMEDIARYASRLLVMDKGRVYMDGEPHQVFSRQAELEELGLSSPQLTQLMHRLKEGGAEVDSQAITMDEAVASLASWLRRREDGKH